MYTHWQVAMNDDVVLFKQLDDHKNEHRKLDEEIKHLEEGFRDEMQLARLKKRKLQLRDRISFIEDQITPDIIA